MDRATKTWQWTDLGRPLEQYWDHQGPLRSYGVHIADVHLAKDSYCPCHEPLAEDVNDGLNKTPAQAQIDAHNLWDCIGPGDASSFCVSSMLPPALFAFPFPLR